MFHLSLRATQGFLASVVTLMRLELPVPEYTTMCRRPRALDVRVGIAASDCRRHIVIDSTGLKVFGAGEWNLRKHGMRRGRRRIWRKLHLGVDERTKEIVAVDLTSSRVHDCRMLPGLLGQTPGVIAQVSADKAYDSAACYVAVLARDAATTIPPRRRARVSKLADPPPARAARDEVLRCIDANGRYAWRETSGATRLKSRRECGVPVQGGCRREADIALLREPAGRGGVEVPSSESHVGIGPAGIGARASSLSAASIGRTRLPGDLCNNAALWQNPSEPVGRS